MKSIKKMESSSALKIKKRGILSLVIALLFFICIISGTSSPLSGQVSKKNPEKEEKPSNRTKYPKKLKSKKTWEQIIDIPGKILYIPFLLLDEISKPVFSLVGVAPVAYSKLVRLLISKDGKRGLLPSLSPRKGGGITLFQKDISQKGANLNISTRIGLRWRQYYELELDRVHITGPIYTNLKLFSLNYPDETYYGMGNGSKKDNKTTFAQKQAGALLTLQADLGHRTEITTLFGYDSTAISDGNKPDVSPISELPQWEIDNLPEIQKRVGLMSLQMQFSHDSRNRTGNPTAGWKISLKGGRFQEPGSGNYGFWKASTDITRYIHLFYGRTFVIRIASEFTRRAGSRKIPFYYLSELGRRRTIKGFSRGRFRDNDMLLSSLEYRFPLMRRGEKQLGLDAVYFFDAGQVSKNIFEDFSIRNFHVGFGGGIRLFSRNNVILQMLVGKSRDGIRFYLILY